MVFALTTSLAREHDMTQRPTEGRTAPLMIGIDVGSTTVKAVVVDPRTLEILWADYQRHETRQPEKVQELLVAIGGSFPQARLRVFVTGSGSGPLAEPLGGRFVPFCEE